MSPAGGPPARPDLEEALLSLEAYDDRRFGEIEAEIRAYQVRYNPVVAAFAEAGRYLPVEAFRRTRVACFGPDVEECRFLSSGTGDAGRASHPVRSLDFYDRVVERGFDRVFGPGSHVILGLVPKYAPESSLVRMIAHLARRSGHPAGGSFAGQADRLEHAAASAVTAGHRLVLIGAAFALVDLVERGVPGLPPGSVVVETGGMKTRRREISREELHDCLSSGFGVPRDGIWSEYGMCELFSQAWARGGSWFDAPPWVRFAVVDPADPDRSVPDGSPGRLALTDLGNLYSAAHLLTDDAAVAYGRRFRVLGRLSGATLRGCNFLFES